MTREEMDTLLYTPAERAVAKQVDELAKKLGRLDLLTQAEALHYLTGYCRTAEKFRDGLASWLETRVDKKAVSA